MRGAALSDRGASAVLIAFTMILIMGVAMVVIDGGAAFSERRQAQAGVDFASLAALHSAVGANPEDAAAAEAIAVTEANLPGRALQAWAACADPTRPPEYTIVSSLSPCVSFTENFAQARVRLPLDTLDNTFGNVLGFASTDVSAAAESVQISLAKGDVLPFTAGTGSIVCLFSNQAPQAVEPCSGPASGTFGYLDIALYGDSTLDNPITCTNGTVNVRTAINVAKGSDHLMAEWDGGAAVNDHGVCPNKSEDINQLVVQTGSPGAAATSGLLTGVSGSINGEAFGSSDGRLEPTSESTGTVSVRNYSSLDDTPLWTYLDDPGCNWSASPVISGDVDSHNEMLACLQDWTPGDGAIFIKSLEDHNRFGAVPIFTVYPTGPGSYFIDSFAPVWIETLYFNCNASGSPDCDTIFSPGESGGSSPCPNDFVVTPTFNCGHSDTPGPDDVEGVSAFRMSIAMLHLETQAFFPGAESLREVSLLN
jgi:Flp pilus assembly protein TadG